MFLSHDNVSVQGKRNKKIENESKGLNTLSDFAATRHDAAAVRQAANQWEAEFLRCHGSHVVTLAPIG